MDRLRRSSWKVALAAQVGLVWWAVIADGKFFLGTQSGQLPESHLSVMQAVQAFFEAELLLLGMALALAVLVWFARALSVDGAAWLLAGATLVLAYVALTQTPKPLALAVLLANPVLIWSFAARDGRRGLFPRKHQAPRGADPYREVRRGR